MISTDIGNAAVDEPGSLYYDLHLHSCLSPCGDQDMTVNNIANMAAIIGLDIIALTDHNSLKNCPAFFAACERAGVLPVAGVELTTKEEIHIVCYFESLETGMVFDRFLTDRLLPIQNRPEIFGHQFILDEQDNIIAEEGILLLSATDIGIEDLPPLMDEYRGVAAPAHIDRASFSLISSFGYVPPEYPFPCYEVRELARLPELIAQNPCLSKKRILCSSDAHRLEDIADKNQQINLTVKSAAGLVSALRTK